MIPRVSFEWDGICIYFDAYSKTTLFLYRISSYCQLIPREKEQYIQALLAPENEVEERIVADPKFREGLFWGKPRYGHPEGQVILHIREVLDNVEQLVDIDKKTYNQLRLATLVHDSFKYKEYLLATKAGIRRPEFHHATLAADYLAQFVEDDALLKVVRWHDEAYYCWRLLNWGQLAAHEERWDTFERIIGDDMQLFYLFFKCDTCTGDKNLAPLAWFEETVANIQLVEFVMQE